MLRAVDLSGRPVPDDLLRAEVEVLGDDGETRTRALGDLVRGAPALVVFLRHLACPGCSEELALLAPRLPELDGVGVRVVLVTPAASPRLLAFAKRMRLDGGSAVLVADPSLASYAAAGLSRSRWATYGPRPVLTSLRLYAAGHHVAREADDGDVTQQGGCLLLDAKGQVLVHHRARDLGDHVPLDRIVEEALRLGAERATGWA